MSIPNSSIPNSTGPNRFVFVFKPAKGGPSDQVRARWDLRKLFFERFPASPGALLAVFVFVFWFGTPPVPAEPPGGGAGWPGSWDFLYKLMLMLMLKNRF